MRWYFEKGKPYLWLSESTPRTAHQALTSPWLSFYLESTKFIIDHEYNMLVGHSFFLLMPGIKALGWQAPDCPGARIIKIEIVIIIIKINAMKAFYVLSISIFIKSHCG